VILWLNRLSSGKDFETMMRREQAEWSYMEAVSSPGSCPILKLTSSVIFGPAATKWYQFLQKRINLKSHNATIAARVVADQTIFSTCNLALFLSSMSYLEGTDPKKKLEKSYWPGLKANWALWPAVQAVNFKFVPLDQRVLVVNIVSLGWNCFLSWLNSSG
jgi:protein Mpv17